MRSNQQPRRLGGFPSQHDTLNVSAGEEFQGGVPAGGIYTIPPDQVIGVFDNCSPVKKWTLAEPLIPITLENKILGHAHLWHQSSEPLAGNVAHTPLDDSPRRLVGDLVPTLVATHKDAALRGLAQAHQRLHQFTLPIASHSGDANDLTPRHAQRNPLNCR